ncbi:putative glycoside hydrolase family 3 protein [Phaeomoniella chlamydospora]|uniref:Probable beta-glucosidase E n=1 Tax=Phaeomoniella chlamydospora TaxID=158046 RepID=A0A0G2DY80_PHACM|nr:putative glycoside hydrolase family 3 protein [Phaeomoniella chlamydospora]
MAGLIAIIAIAGGGGFWVYKKAPSYGESPPWYPSPLGGASEAWEKSFEKAKIMVEKMTLPEKVNITTGVGWSMDLCVGNTGPATQVGFPALCLQDGPLGIRFADKITSFPAGITTGATWNRTLIRERGAAHAREARLKGVHVLLGPAMGPLGRQPAGGRVWEGFGSDPVLQGIAAAETIEGIQAEGIMATAKHYVGNEQEHFRQSFEWGLPNALSANIDDRTLHEVYAWPFADSVRAGVASVMCSYQMVNNSYTCGNSKLLNGILKDELGFQGFIQSDWLAQRSGVASALAGLDMSMPGDGLRWANGESLWGPHLSLAALNGSLPMERLNDMVTRIVAAWYQLGQDKWENDGPNFSSWTNDEEGLLHPGSDSEDKGAVNKFIEARDGKEGGLPHNIIARQVAAEGTVLVKNENGMLPLSRKPPSDSKLRIGIYGEDAGPAAPCEDRGCNKGTLISGWGSGAVDLSRHVDPLAALKDALSDSNFELTSDITNGLSKAGRKSLEDQDICIVFANADAGEGFRSVGSVHGDRNDLDLQKGGDALIRTVAKGCGNGNGKVIAVIHAVGPVILENFIDEPSVKAVLLANLPGEESGNALVDVMFGDIDASGRLPYTVGKSLKDYGPGAQIMYYPNGVVPQATFSEGLYIDYRYFDKENISPRYEFGYGLSYTTFSYSDLNITTLKPKSALPSPRPDSIISPPTYPTDPPSPEEALIPSSFRKPLQKYIYPYITSTSLVKKGHYPYPEGFDTPQSLSPAGGSQGGNPSLYDQHILITFKITNTGSRHGSDVPQLYLSFPSNVKDTNGDQIDFPIRVLRAFDKIELDADESKTVEMKLTRRDLSYWSVVRQNWVMPGDAEGRFRVMIGRSSRDQVLSGEW